MRVLAAVMLSLAVMGCSALETHNDVDALKEVKASGSPFTQRLTAEYKTIVAAKQKTLDYADAKHFAKKGLMTAEGKVVLPEPLSNWHLDDASATQLRAARIRLLQRLNAGGRAMAPFEAGAAQGAFDCWIEQQEQNWASNKAAPCKAKFDAAMAELEARMTKAVPKSDKAGQPLPAAPKAALDPNAVPATMDEGMFLVFFDFDAHC